MPSNLHTVLSYDRAEAEEGQYYSFGFSPSSRPQLYEHGRGTGVLYRAKQTRSIEATAQMEHANGIQPLGASVVRDYVCWSPG